MFFLRGISYVGFLVAYHWMNQATTMTSKVDDVTLFYKVDIETLLCLLLLAHKTDYSISSSILVIVIAPQKVNTSQS